MRWLFHTLIFTLTLVLRRMRPCGSAALVAEVFLLRQQLLVLKRGKKKCPAMSLLDRVVMALCTLVMTPRRVKRAAIAVAESTLLDLHRALVARKYSRLFGKSTKLRPGRKGPSKELIKLVVETKEKNPSYGCPKIAMLISNVLGQKIDEETVRRILKKHYHPPPGKGPSWLVPIGNAPGKLWSLDLFRLESVFLRTYWVMAVMDQFTRRIVGFCVWPGDLEGGNVCYMFNMVGRGLAWPKYLSTDNDPLFTFWRWKTLLNEEYGITEIKSVPRVPWSHPFVERLIGSCRREFTDRILFWGKADLEAKLKLYQEYFNEYRVHYAHAGKTPSELVAERKLATVSLTKFTWKPVCGGLFHTPIAA